MGKLTVNKHNISLLDTFLSENSSESLDLVKKLLVSEALLSVRNWTVVEDGRLVSTSSQNMTVNAVIASR